VNIVVAGDRGQSFSEMDVARVKSPASLPRLWAMVKSKVPADALPVSLCGDLSSFRL